MKLFLIFLGLSWTFMVQGQSADRDTILNTLQQQTNAWNKGDLEGFMRGYWKSDSLVFLGKNGVTYGWQQVLDNYKAGYKDKNGMGVLDFSNLKLQRLCGDLFNVIGKWHITLKSGDLQGYFSLIFKRIDGKWRIVQDHSS